MMEHIAEMYFEVAIRLRDSVKILFARICMAQFFTQSEMLRMLMQAVHRGF